MTYVLITFHKPMVLLPQDPEDPLTDNFPYNNAQIQAWYSYNLSKERRTLLNNDWYYFVDIISMPRMLMPFHQKSSQDKKLGIPTSTF